MSIISRPPTLSRQEKVITETRKFETTAGRLKEKFPDIATDFPHLNRIAREIRIRAALIALFTRFAAGNLTSEKEAECKMVMEALKNTAYLGEGQSSLYWITEYYGGLSGRTIESIIKGRYQPRPNSRAEDPYYGALPAELNISVEVMGLCLAVVFSWSIFVPLLFGSIIFSRGLSLINNKGLIKILKRSVDKLDRLIKKAPNPDEENYLEFVKSQIIPLLEEIASYYKTLETEKLWEISTETVFKVNAAIVEVEEGDPAKAQAKGLIEDLTRKLKEFYEASDKIRKTILELKKKTSDAYNLNGMCGLADRQAAQPAEVHDEDLDVRGNVSATSQEIRDMIGDLYGELSALDFKA